MAARQDTDAKEKAVDEDGHHDPKDMTFSRAILPSKDPV